MVSLGLAQGVLIDFIAWETILKNRWSILGPGSFVVWMVISGNSQRLFAHISFPFRECTHLHDLY